MQNIFNLSSVFEKQKNILLVEDDPQWKLILANTLNLVTKNPNIAYAKSTETARQILSSGKTFDLVLADFMLEGGETGADLWLSHQRFDRKIPFILISGKSPTEIIKISNGNQSLPVMLSKQSPTDQMVRVLKQHLKLIETKQNLTIFTTCLFLTLMFLLIPVPLLPSKFNSILDFKVVSLTPSIHPLRPNQIKPPPHEEIQKLPSSPQIRIDRIISPELREKIRSIVRISDPAIRPHAFKKNRLLEASSSQEKLAE